jgi:hypothetical protein
MSSRYSSGPASPGHTTVHEGLTCGAPKKLPAVTAYVYCDYCAALIDYDLRRACEGDTTPGPGYAAAVNAAQAASRTAVAAGDRDTYRELQRTVYEAYAANVPMAVSHRASNDPGYRAAYVSYMAEFALARAFDPPPSSATGAAARSTWPARRSRAHPAAPP